MVKIITVLNSEKKFTEDLLVSKVKEVSDKIGEPTSSAIFITVQDALASGSKIFLIEEEESKKKSNKSLTVQRDFIPA